MYAFAEDEDDAEHLTGPSRVSDDLTLGVVWSGRP